MRANTSLRTAFRFGMMMVAATGVTFAASQASADVSSSPSPAGNNSSTGSAALKFEYNQALPTSIDTGFFGPSAAQIKALLEVKPVKDGGPLFTVDMPKGAVIEASWSNDKKIVLKAANGSQTDGTIKVRHTLVPSMLLRISAFGQSIDLDFDGSKYLNKLPGSRFNFDSRATQPFSPWGFTQVDTKLNAPDLDNSVLFSEPLSVFDNILDPTKFAGTFGIRATTKPTFSYKTTKVMLSGSQAPITSLAGESVVDAIDGDFMEVMATVEGEMKVAGAVEFQPYLTITKAFGSSFGTNLAFTAFKKDYTVAPQKVAFQSALVHIALPNVHAPKEGIDLGAVKAGGSATKTVTIENSGELPATMTLKSSDPQFEVPGGAVTIAAKSKSEVQIKFAPNNAGSALADITVMSNDPDSPEQTFKIGANGADVGGKGGDDADLPSSSPSADSGCGCKTAGTTTSTGGWAGIGLLALGITVAARRRRTNTAE